jgi:hypothetical protein
MWPSIRAWPNGTIGKWKVKRFRERRRNTMKLSELPPHITREWDEKWNPICVPDCPRCAYDSANLPTANPSIPDSRIGNDQYQGDIITAMQGRVESVVKLGKTVR